MSGAAAFPAGANESSESSAESESSADSETSDAGAESSGSSGSGGPAEAAQKKARVRRDGVVIMSTLGDMRPDEIVMDTLANCCLNYRMTVRNYVVMSDFANRPMFLANKEYAADATGKKAAYRYVKQMIPKTSCFKDIECDVMIIHAHGGARRVNVENNTKRPYYLTFHEAQHVSAVSGERKVYSSTSAAIYSCSSYYDGVNQYTIPDGASTLSGVLGESRLVLLLCCCGRNIIEEYSSETRDGDKPDLVAFLMDSPICDVSIYIFLAMLISALEERKMTPSPWDEFFKRSVCHVLYWIKKWGVTGGEFWQFLENQKFISVREDRYSYRIKGFINNFRLAKGDEDRVLRELQSVTLLQWTRGAGGTLGSYDWDVAPARTEDELAGLVYTAPFRKASAPAGMHGNASQLDVMLLELKGLLRGA